MQDNISSYTKRILAIVGMPGSGKSETAAYIEEKGYARIRFGIVTEEGLREKGLPLSPEHEESFREELRKELGMAAYAIRSESKISDLLEKTDTIVLDGLYSWEEYQYLVRRFPFLTLVHVYAEPEIRYKRLATRSKRSFTIAQARNRDISEIEHLNKGGPIAMADHIIVNNTDITQLHKQLDLLLAQVGRRSDK